MPNRSAETNSTNLMQTIVHWEVAGERRELHLKQGETVQIGRGSENDVALEGALISRRHAEIVGTPGGFELRDLGSRNGTFVNEQIVNTPVLLQAGDIVDIANIRITYDAVAWSASLDTQPSNVTLRINSV